MMLVLGLVLLAWVVLLVVVVAMFHVATGGPTPQRTAHLSLAPTRAAIISADAA
jgi:hypothetical protein